MEDRKIKKVKLNLFDGIVILAILLAAAGVYLILHGNSVTLTGQTGEDKTILYTILITGVDESQADAIAVGDVMQETGDGYVMGTVTQVQVVPHTSQVTDLEQAVVQELEVPGYISFYVTLQVAVQDRETCIKTGDGVVLRRGISMYMANGTILANATIVWMEREDAA